MSGKKILLNRDGLSSDFLRLGCGDSSLERLETGLVKANLMKAGDELRSFEDVTHWRRGGAETFIATSVLVTTSGERHHVIGKAFASFASPERACTSWLRRRLLLEELGIRVPRLYSVFSGIIFEEFIEAELHIDDCSLGQLIEDIALTAVLLDHGGFEPLCFLKDLRMRAQTVYYVDFGSDLGEPEGTLKDCAKIEIQNALLEPQRSECLSYYNSYFKRIQNSC